MKCIISKASEFYPYLEEKSTVCPCDGAVFDQELNEWVIELSSMDDLKSLLENNSKLSYMNETPSLIIYMRIDGVVEVTFYDGYIE